MVVRVAGAGCGEQGSELQGVQHRALLIEALHRISAGAGPAIDGLELGYELEGEANTITAALDDPDTAVELEAALERLIS